MVLGSHNSWSYLTPRKKWMKLLKFTAQCQNIDIKTQYERYGVRCFDLRLRFDNDGRMYIVHGLVEYDYSYPQLLSDLSYLNHKGDCYVRVIHDVRTKCSYTPLKVCYFVNRCEYIKSAFSDIKFWCGENLYNHNEDYEFINHLTCDEYYSSVRFPKLIDDWFPKLYAKINNKKIIKKGTDKDILMIDFINY